MKLPLRVLIVEDNAHDAALLVREIRNAGFEPEWCRVETEEAFLEKLNPEIDIVLLDYMMPRFDGLRALKLLEQRKMGIPCILVSASVSEKMAVAAIKQGAADYLLKDRLARLGPAVSQAVEKSRLQKERAQAENTVRESEERFRQLAENIEDVFWLTDLTMSQVFYVSPAYEKIWGRLCTDLYASPRAWLDAVHPQDREKVFAAAIGKEAKNRYDEEYRIVRPDGSIRWIYDRAFPVWGADGKVHRIVGVARDITEHKHAEERLRASESQLARSQQLAHLGSWEWDVPSDTVNWSNEMFRIFGMEPSEMKVDYCFVLSRLHPEDSLAFSETIRHAAESGEPYAFDCRIVLPDGTARVIHNEGTVISNEHGTPLKMFGTVQDITAHHQDEQLLRESQSQLRALADRLIAAREEEARRIARELHDEMGQYLTALKLDATWLRQRMNICCEAGLGLDLNERLDRMLRLIDTTIERSRKICTELRSGVLDELGLVAALEWQAQEFEERTNIFCSLSLPIADPPLDYQRATTVFRIFQEVLTNIAKHADATEVDVRLEMAGELMTLRVSDNGRGISKSEIAGATGFGLLGMRERALGAGGSVSICGEPGQGTIVVLQLPANCKISS